ncbi:MAG: hypothetical protein QNJ00_13220 [Woeseiaceae bacterium]|nr:hypothetical protein [Woeseiaceae bacterium]
MKKTILTILATLCLGACAPAQAQLNCVAYGVLELGPRHMSYETRNNLCAFDGKFRIFVTTEPNSDFIIPDITVDEKPGATYPISGDNDPYRWVIFAEVENQPPLFSYHEFSIKAEGVGTLDPRVRVVPSFVFRDHRLKRANEFLINNGYPDLLTLTVIEKELEQSERVDTGLAELIELAHREIAENEMAESD